MRQSDLLQLAICECFRKQHAFLSTDSMTAFFPEKLVPFIRVKRGLKACDTQQQFKVLQQLPQLFKKHDVTSVLTDIILAGICNAKFYEKIPAALLVDINASLPSDDQLHLKDSIYHSRLVENPNENKVATNQKRTKLPLTLLRIPSDLQYHLFHFLDFKELMNVQKVCRALCIAARNPSSIYSMKLEYESYSGNHKLLSEWLSRPRSLDIRLWAPESPDLIIGNTTWGQQVTHLSIATFGRRARDRDANPIGIQNLGHFHNLTKGEISRFPRILLNGQIASYFTLKELTLRGDDWTEDIIDELRKFKNLEHLSLECIHNDSDSDNADSCHSEPISFTKLREFSIKLLSGKLPNVFHRVLIGSHPRSVTVDVPWMHDECVLPQTVAAVHAIRAIDHLNIVVSSMHFFDSLCPLLRRAQKQEKGPFLEQCELIFHIFGGQDVLLPPIISLFQCAKRSKLMLYFSEPYLAPKCNIERFVQDIRNAPNETFTEIMVYISIGILTSRMHDGDWCGEVLNAIEDEGCSKEDRPAVRRVVMESIDKAEEWLKAWLVFDENRMKEIGLRKLDIAFQSNLEQDNEHWDVIDPSDWNDELEAKTKRVDAVLDIMADEWIQQRAERWSDIDKRCIVKVNPEKQEYTVTLTLKS